jgi:hypothetical protein
VFDQLSKVKTLTDTKLDHKTLKTLKKEHSTLFENPYEDKIFPKIT